MNSSTWGVPRAREMAGILVPVTKAAAIKPSSGESQSLFTIDSSSNEI